MVALENAYSSWLLRSRKITLLLVLVEAYANTSWAALTCSEPIRRSIPRIDD